MWRFLICGCLRWVAFTLLRSTHVLKEALRRTNTLRWDTNVRNGVCHLQFATWSAKNDDKIDKFFCWWVWSQTFRIERTSGWTSWEFLGFSGWKNVSELFWGVSWVFDDMISCDFYLMMSFGFWWQHSTVWWVWWLEVSTLESTLVVYDLRTCWAQQIMVKSHLDPSVLVRYHPTEGFAGRKEKARVNQLELK